jgi:hypothetical protein
MTGQRAACVVSARRHAVTHPRIRRVTHAEDGARHARDAAAHPSLSLSPHDTHAIYSSKQAYVTSLFAPLSIYANAVQQARRNEKSRRPTQQTRGLATSQHIWTINFNNIFNPHLHAFPVTSTLLPILTWSQHLLPSSSHRRISIASSVLCVHPGPVTGCLVTSRNR